MTQLTQSFFLQKKGKNLEAGFFIPKDLLPPAVHTQIPEIPPTVHTAGFWLRACRTLAQLNAGCFAILSGLKMTPNFLVLLLFSSVSVYVVDTVIR